MASNTTDAFLEAWHATVREKDLARMDAWVADDATLSSPALFVPKRGKAAVKALLADVLASISDYRVTRTWIDGNELLLEFDANVGRMQLQGIDRIGLGPDGKLAHLTVFIRPFRGLLALMGAIGELELRRMGLARRIAARTRLALRGRL
jgi:hypothetical protein